MFPRIKVWSVKDENVAKGEDKRVLEEVGEVAAGWSNSHIVRSVTKELKGVPTNRIFVVTFTLELVFFMIFIEYGC